MNEFKFYDVKVGMRTRSGNLNVVYSFVAQSDKNQSSVYSYYSKKYTGLTVEVSQINEVVNDEIPTINSDYSIFSNEENKTIEDLEKKIKKLSSSFNKFSGKVRYNGMTKEITIAIKELEEINNQYHKKKTETRKHIEKYISEKYGNVIVSDVTLGEWDHNTGDIPFTATLNGKITPDENSI